jgi:hypothetical protein
VRCDGSDIISELISGSLFTVSWSHLTEESVGPVKTGCRQSASQRDWRQFYSHRTVEPQRNCDSDGSFTQIADVDGALLLMRGAGCIALRECDETLAGGDEGRGNDAGGNAGRHRLGRVDKEALD